MKSMLVLLALAIISEVSPQDGGEKTDSTTTDSLGKSEKEIKEDYEKAECELKESRAVCDKLKAKVDEEVKMKNETYDTLIILHQNLTDMKKAYDIENGRYRELYTIYNKSRDAVRALRNELKQARSNFTNLRAKNDEAIRNYEKRMGKSDKGKENGCGGVEDTKQSTSESSNV